jgi:hypothetical protein
MSYTPTVPTNLNVIVTNGVAALTWDASPDADFSHFIAFRDNQRIYEGSSTACSDTNASLYVGTDRFEHLPSTADFASQHQPNPTDPLIPGYTYRWTVCTVNTHGIKSGKCAAVVQTLSPSSTVIPGVLGDAFP